MCIRDRPRLILNAPNPNIANIPKASIKPTTGCWKASNFNVLYFAFLLLLNLLLNLFLIQFSAANALMVDIPFIDSPIKLAKSLVDSWLFSDDIKTLFPKLFTDKTIKLLAFQHPVVGFIEAFGILTILGLGAFRINLGLLNSEEFSSFFAAILMLIDPISHISTNFNEYKQAEASMKRLQKINLEPLEKEEKNLENISKIDGKIEFKKVSFEYKKDNRVLKDITLQISKGQVIAFVGSSGAGKSTMMALILKFITPSTGEIYIDDKEIKSISAIDIRSNVALVQQQPYLFSGKIIDVIKMGRKFSEEDVIKSAKIANAHKFIQKLPSKYDTLITERGTNLSGGQIQRIAIARAILGNPSILLLDEATSALDADSEAEVQKGLKQAMKNRTVIIIAHRLATTQGADKIVVFDKGNIIDIGKHIELINKEGIYKELCEKQLIKIK